MRKQAKKEVSSTRRTTELLEQFSRYYEEVEIPLLKKMHKILNEFYREYKRLHPKEVDGTN